MIDPTPGKEPDALHGWKDIAAHLGCSVRSAQRKEATQGLPVKRISTPEGGHIVYASRIEIDAWREHLTPETDGEADLAADGEADFATDAEADPGSTSTSTHDRPRRRVLGTIAVAIALFGAGLIGGIVWITSVLPSWTRSSVLAVHEDAVIALTSSGRTAWRHSLGRSVHIPDTLTAGQGPVTGDLDGDGELETAVPIALAPPRSLPNETDLVIVFDARGRPRARIQPDLSIRDRDAVFTGPWRLNTLAFSAEPRSRLWVAYQHHTTDLAVVVEMTPDGAQAIRLLANGRIQALAHWSTRRGSYLAAGGVDGVHGAAVATFLDLQSRPALWTRNADITACAQCPSDRPHATLLFPNSDVTRATQRPFGSVFAIRTGERERLTLEMTNGTGVVARDAIAIVEPDLTVAGVSRTDGHWSAHRALETAGRLEHTVDRCPDARSPVIVRRWSREAGWSEQAVPPSPSSVRLVNDRTAGAARRPSPGGS